MKVCIKCGRHLTKDTTTWYRQKNYIHKCNECVRSEKREQASARRSRDPALAAMRSLRCRHKQKEHNPTQYTANQMAASAKKRAGKLGLECDIDADYIRGLCQEKCPIMGCAIKYGGGEKTKFSASLDRIDSARGYVKGNVAVISLLANLMKSSATEEELVIFAHWVMSTLGGLRTFEKVKGAAQ